MVARASHGPPYRSTPGPQVHTCAAAHASHGGLRLRKLAYELTSGLAQRATALAAPGAQHSPQPPRSHAEHTRSGLHMSGEGSRRQRATLHAWRRRASHTPRGKNGKTEARHAWQKRAKGHEGRTSCSAARLRCRVDATSRLASIGFDWLRLASLGGAGEAQL